MSQHIVIYRGTDSKVGYHQTEDIHDAVSLVEQLRNEQGVEHAKIFRLEEVNFEYRPYFRVELKAGGPSLGTAPDVAAVAAPAAEKVADAPAAEAPAATAAPNVTDTKVADTKVADTKAPETKAPEVKVEEKVETAAAASTEPENGVSARRGLFGR